MEEALEAACRAVGWTELYRNYLPDGAELRPRGNGTELECRSPFPGSTDSTPSMSINVVSGVWADFHMRDRLVGARRRNGWGGNIVMFMAYMAAVPATGGRLNPDFGAAERRLRLDLGMSRPVDLQWYNAAVARLATAVSPFHAVYQAYRPLWTADVMRRLRIGWDVDRQRLVLPIQDEAGDIVNCIMYRVGPGDGPKTYWLQNDRGPQNLPFPHSVAWNRSTTRPLWTVEGVGDAITLCSMDIDGFTGTYGAASPVPWLGTTGAELVLGRNMVVCTDEDDAGRLAAPRILAAFQPYAASMRRVRIPEWQGMPAKRDVTDWAHMVFARDEDVRAVRREILAAANEAEPMGAEAAYDAEPTHMTLDEALDTANMGRRFVTHLKVLSTASSRHASPYNVALTCRENHAFCRSCPMQGRGGNWQRVVDHRSPLALSIMTESAERGLREMKRAWLIPEQCPEVRAQAITAMDVQIAQVSPPYQTLSLDTVATGEAESRRTEMFIVRADSTTIKPGHDYEVRGFAYPAPKNQKVVLVVDRAIRTDSSSTQRSLSYSDASRLRSLYSPIGMSPAEALAASADDIAASVTGIRMRTDIHELYRAVWHCALSFSVGGERVSRGWIDAFVVGDTRCGKSAAFKTMSNWYGEGVLVDCKMQSIPGLLGAVETSTVTGERYVLPGIVPLNDGRGPIGFDEYTGPRPGSGRTSIMEAMSSTRAEGGVRVNKAAHAYFKAEVRMLWFANPGDGRLMVDIPGFGVEIFKKLVGQPEDIARFDIAMAVTQQDVPLEELLRPIPLRPPAASQEDARMLLDWCRSREHDDFEWEPDAVELLARSARRMVDRYDSSIPLVEGATQRHKIAKVAVALASASFSSPDGRRVVVTVGHVAAAHGLFSRLYDKSTFAYHAYSARKRLESNLSQPDALEKLLTIEIGESHMVQSLFNLRRVDKFSERLFRTMCNVRQDNVATLLRAMANHRAIEPAGDDDKFRLTRAFVKWIDSYIRNNEHREKTTGATNIATAPNGAGANSNAK